MTSYIFMLSNRSNCLPLAFSFCVASIVYGRIAERSCVTTIRATRRNGNSRLSNPSCASTRCRSDFPSGPLSVPFPINYNPLTPEPRMERCRTAPKFTSTWNACFQLRHRLICTFAPKEFPYINIRWKKTYISIWRNVPFLSLTL